MSNSKYSVILRRHSPESEREEYSLIDCAASVAKAGELAMSFRGEPKDIIIVCDTAHVSDIQRLCRHIYVADEHGVTRKVKAIPYDIPGKRNSWLEFWEEPKAEADGLLFCARQMDVDLKLRVLALCACVRTTLKYVPDGELIPISVVETVEAWARGDVSRDQADKANKSAWELNRLYDRRQNTLYSTTLTFAHLSNVMRDDANYEDYDNALFDAAAVNGNYEENIVALSSVVREYIPLSTVLIAASKRRQHTCYNL